MSKQEMIDALRGKSIDVKANWSLAAIEELYNEHFGEEPEFVKTFKKLTAKKAVLIADKNTNTNNCILSVLGDTFKVFDKAKYLETPKRQTQKDWVNGLEEGDGFVTIKLSESKDKSDCFSVLMSVLKGTDGVQVSDDGKNITPQPEVMHKMEKGVLKMV